MLNINSANFSKNLNHSFSNIKFNSKNHYNFSKKNLFKKTDNDIILNNLINLNNSNHLFLNDFKNLKVIGQFDKKLIITIRLKDKSIIFFDQHAVHERILYEFYSKLIFNSLFDIKNQIKSNEIKINNFENIYDKFILTNPISIKSFEYSINMKNFTKYFNCNNNIKHNLLCFIFTYDKITDNINFYSVPIILDKVHKLEKLIIIFRKLINELEEYVNLINDKNEKILELFDDFIKNKACRNAIKFNEILNDNILNLLINELYLCKIPFQCAHGRHNFFIELNK